MTLSVYVVADRLRLLGSYDVPCAGEPCDALAIAGYDQGMVFVRGDNGTRVIDPAAGQAATWTQVTDSRVTDVRNRVILAEDPDPARRAAVRRSPTAPGGSPQPPAADALLTLDGAWQVGHQHTLAVDHPRRRRRSCCRCPRAPGR